MILVYQAYGREDILRQTLFSTISLFSVLDEKSPLQVWIYTDCVKMFTDYFGEFTSGDKPRLKLIEVSAPQIQKWRGSINFVHRVKVEILIDAAAQFLGSIFYVDGDTFFRQDPTALFARVDDKNSLMHIAENSLSAGRDPLSKKITKFVKKNTFYLQQGEHQGEKVQLTPETVMWNAGALGLSQNNKSFLSRVLALTDKMYELYPKHVMEQLAFSHYLQSFTKIFAGDAYIGHYWDQKDLYQKSIDDFLKYHKNWQAGRMAYAKFSWPTLPQLPIARWFS